jgi:hypothetical protein
MKKSSILLIGVSGILPIFTFYTVISSALSQPYSIASNINTLFYPLLIISVSLISIIPFIFIKAPLVKGFALAILANMISLALSKMIFGDAMNKFHGSTITMSAIFTMIFVYFTYEPITIEFSMKFIAVSIILYILFLTVGSLFGWLAWMILPIMIAYEKFSTYEDEDSDE